MKEKTLEEKLTEKIEAIFKTYVRRDMHKESNQKAYLIDMVGAVRKILEAEVNIRVRKATHKQNAEQG